MRLDDVAYLGIDEVYLGKRIKRKAKQIKAVAIDMAKTIRKRMEGLLAYWNHGCLTNASQEGFNNKIGWLTRQAYGYRDERYLHLKIYDLPNLSTRRNL